MIIVYFALCDIDIHHSWIASNKLCDVFYCTLSSSIIGAVMTNVVAVQLPEKYPNGVQLAAGIKLRFTSAITVKFSTQITANTLEFDNDSGAINFSLTSTLAGFQWKAYVKAAREKFQNIQKAYEQIKRERGF